MAKIKLIIVRSLDILLSLIFCIIGLLLSLVVIFFLDFGNKKRVQHSSERQLLVFSEASDYDSMKTAGAVSLLPNWLIGGYFKKVYIVFFPTLKKRVVNEVDNFEIIELGTKARFLKQNKMSFSYTILNTIYYFWSVFSMRNFVKRNITFIHGAGVHHTALAALFLRKLTGLPSCISVHSDDEFRYKFMKGYGGHWKIMSSRWFTVQVHKFIFSTAPSIFIIRESLKDWAIRMGASPNRIRIFPHVINSSDFNYVDGDKLLSEYKLEDKHLVVFAGRLSKENYIYDIIKIAGIVSDKLKEVRFIIVGDGIERKGMEDAVAKAGLDKIVLFLGYQPRNKVFELRKHANVNLCLMAGFSLIEAALAGRPLVSYDVEWHYELVRNFETGVLIKEHDIDSAAQAIMTLINDPALAKRLGDNARSLAYERHDSKIVQKLRANIYEEIIRGNK